MRKSSAFLYTWKRPSLTGPGRKLCASLYTLKRHSLSHTGPRAEAWCLLSHADTSPFLSLRQSRAAPALKVSSAAGAVGLAP